MSNSKKTDMQTPSQHPLMRPLVAPQRTAKIYQWPSRVATPAQPSSDLRENARRIVEITIHYLTVKR